MIKPGEAVDEASTRPGLRLEIPKSEPMLGERGNEEMVLQEASAAYLTEADDIDLWLLQDSLVKTPWERMQANDDTLNFAESLRVAMRERSAKLK